jgi:hypothetical protein
MLSHAAIVESARCISHEGGARSDDGNRKRSIF